MYKNIKLFKMSSYIYKASMTDNYLMQCLQPIVNLHHLDINTGGPIGTI